MRKRQLLGLVWDDIDFSAKTIRLRADSSKTRREWFVPLPDGLIPDLLVLRTRTVEVRREVAPGSQVFCLPLFSRRKQAFKRLRTQADRLDNFFQRLRKAMPTDMPCLSAHRIRHTTATILANSVPELKGVQEQLEHASIATTYIYAHPDLASMRKALDVLSPVCGQ
jgi:integrase